MFEPTKIKQMLRASCVSSFFLLGEIYANAYPRNCHNDSSDCFADRNIYYENLLVLLVFIQKFIEK